MFIFQIVVNWNNRPDFPSSSAANYRTKCWRDGRSDKVSAYKWFQVSVPKLCFQFNVLLVLHKEPTPFSIVDSKMVGAVTARIVSYERYWSMVLWGSVTRLAGSCLVYVKVQGNFGGAFEPRNFLGLLLLSKRLSLNLKFAKLKTRIAKHPSVYRSAYILHRYSLNTAPPLR